MPTSSWGSHVLHPLHLDMALGAQIDSGEWLHENGQRFLVRSDSEKAGDMPFTDDYGVISLNRGLFIELGTWVRALERAGASGKDVDVQLER